MSPGYRIKTFCLFAAVTGAGGGCASDAATPEHSSPEGQGGDAGVVTAGPADALAPPPDSPMAAGDSAPDAGVQAPAGDAAAAGSPAGCQTDDDCQLVSDCCACQAIPRGEKPASCDPNRSCVMTVCAQYRGVDRARCSAGRCVLGFNCDPGAVGCKRPPPLCPAGQVPQVVNNCYGECVDARQCATVGSCAACRSTDLCVRTVAAPLGLHCQAPAVSNLGEM
jgi:hypothetical protein